MKFKTGKLKWILLSVFLLVVVSTIWFSVSLFAKAAGKDPTETSGNGLKIEYYSNEDATTSIKYKEISESDKSSVYMKVTNNSTQQAKITSISKSVTSGITLSVNNGSNVTIEPNSSHIVELYYETSNTINNNKMYNATLTINYTLADYYNASTQNLKAFKKKTAFKFYYRGSNVLPTAHVLNQFTGCTDLIADFTPTVVNASNAFAFYGEVTNNSSDNVTYNANMYINTTTYKKFQSDGINLSFNIDNKNTNNKNYLNTDKKAITAEWSGNIGTSVGVPTIETEITTDTGIAPDSSTTLTITGNLPTTLNSSSEPAKLTITIPLKCYYNGMSVYPSRSGTLTIELNIYTYTTTAVNTLGNLVANYEKDGFIDDYAPSNYVTEYNNALLAAKESVAKSTKSLADLEEKRSNLVSSHTNMVNNSLRDSKIVTTLQKYWSGDHTGTENESKTTYRLYNAKTEYTLPYYTTYNNNTNRHTSQISGETPDATLDEKVINHTYEYWNVDDTILKNLISQANSIDEEGYTPASITNLRTVVENESVNTITDSDVPNEQSVVDTSATNVQNALNDLVLKTFTITFIDWDQTIIKEQVYDYGTMPSCETPTRGSDEDYNYSFSNWDIPLTEVYENKTYFARYTKTIKNYDVVFKNYDGTVLESKKVDKYQQATYTGEVPTKARTAEWTYTFAGWDKELGQVTQDVEYIATYSQTKNDYKITFRSSDGDILLEQNYPYGATIDYVQEDIITDEYTYRFISWDRAFEPVTESTTYTATFDRTKTRYLITFLNEDGTELQSEDYEYGETPIAPTATKEGNAEWTYTFAGWDKEVTAVTKSEVYTATYNQTKNRYTIRFVNDDDSLIQEYANIEYGETVQIPTATKQNTAEYTYTFAGWDSEVTAVTGNKTYKAVFTRVKNTYLITFLNYNDEVLDSREYEYGVTPNEPTATKEGNAEWTYTFAGWDSEVTMVTGEKTYKATFDQTKNKYRIIFLDEDGTELQNKKYEYGEMPACEIPTKESTSKYTYTFAGWDIPLAEVVEEATYTATYTATANKYKIKYHTNGGTTIDDDTVAYDEEIILAPSPSKTGHDFDDWYTDEDLKNKFVADKMPDHDVDLYAKWTKHKFAITITIGNGITISPNETTVQVEYHDSKEYTVSIRRGYLLTGVKINNVDYDLGSNNKITLNSIEENKNIVIESHKLDPADYTEVDNLLSQIPEDLSKYDPRTVATLNEVLGRLNRDLYETEQAELDAYVDELEAAIQGLKLSGVIEKEDKADTNYGKADAEIKDYQIPGLFTDEELERIWDGENAKIYLEVEDITDSISDTDKALLENKALKGKYDISLFLDINLMKQIESENPIKIEETNQKIKISIKLPKELINNNNKVNRIYKILRLHNGKVDVIDAKLDGDILSFETDKFSSYAIAYIDKEASNNPATNDNLYKYIIMFMLGIFGISSTTLYLKRY